MGGVLLLLFNVLGGSGVTDTAINTDYVTGKVTPNRYGGTVAENLYTGKVTPNLHGGEVVS